MKNLRGWIAKLVRIDLEVPEGRCIACDAVLSTGPTGGRPRSSICAHPECVRTFNTLFTAKQRELQRAGLALELERRGFAA